MTESAYPPVPYITASTLNRYQGRTVRVIGKVTQRTPDHSRYTLETVDGGSLTVHRPHNTVASNDPPGAAWAMVTGVVQSGDLSLQENVVDWLEGPDVDCRLAKLVIQGMQKLPALFAV